MGDSVAILIDVKIKEKSLPIARKALKTGKVRGLAPLVYFLEEAFLDEDGFLRFKSIGRYSSEYFPDEDDGTVTVLTGKWYELRRSPNGTSSIRKNRGSRFVGFTLNRVRE